MMAGEMIMAPVTKLATMRRHAAHMAGTWRDAHDRARGHTMKPAVKRGATQHAVKRGATPAAAPAGFGGCARRHEGKGSHKGGDARAIDHHTHSYAVQPHH